VELLGEDKGSGYKAPRYMVRRSDGQLVQLTDLLYLVAERIDGHRDYDDIARDVSEAYGRKVSADNVRQLVQKSLFSDGLVARPDGSQPELKKVDPVLSLRFRVTILPDKAVNLIAGVLRPLFWPPVMVAVLVGLVVVDVWYFGTHGIGQSLRDTLYQPLVMILLYGLLILSVAWHELGHATACRYGGARPGRIGFGIYIIWPALYTDVTEAYRLGRGGKVRTDLGGMYFNAIFVLATAGFYALTGFEPILVLIMIQHALILYNLMPFLRMDGYFVISDLTGIPDLFQRIKPTIASLLPWKETPKQATDLKRWVRVVVTVWVLSVIPVLLFLFSMMVLAAPRTLATAWDSFFVQWAKVSGAVDDGNGATAAVSGIRAAMVALPVAGMSVTFLKVTKRLLFRFWALLTSRPAAGVAVGLAGAAVLGGAAYLLIPNGEYKPIQPEEQWTFGEGVDALSEVTTGRPSLTEEREKELGGAPTQRDTGVIDDGGDDTGTDTGDTGTDDPDTEQTDDGDTDTDEGDVTEDDDEDTTEDGTTEDDTDSSPSPTSSP
jgi:putative peptide zinc metalloprotease protein